MNRTEFNARILDESIAELRRLNDTKGHDYAGDEDALSNFKADAERLKKIVEVNPALAKWFVYFDKHLSAIVTFLEEGDVKSEPIEGRIDDAILYLLLLKGLIVEMRDAQKPKRRARRVKNEDAVASSTESEIPEAPPAAPAEKPEKTPAAKKPTSTRSRPRGRGRQDKAAKDVLDAAASGSTSASN